MIDDAHLAARKRLLLARSAMLRQQLLSEIDDQLGPPLALVDRLKSGAQWLTAHPVLLASATAALVVWRPQGVLRWAKRALWAWQMWQQVRGPQSTRH